MPAAGSMRIERSADDRSAPEMPGSAAPAETGGPLGVSRALDAPCWGGAPQAAIPTRHINASRTRARCLTQEVWRRAQDESGTVRGSPVGGKGAGWIVWSVRIEQTPCTLRV